MIELMQIKDFLQQIAESIALAIEIDTQVFDRYCNRVAGTVFQPLPPIGGVIRDVLKTGQPRISASPGADPACQFCPKQGHCEEFGFIHYPIIYDNQIVGVMGLICFDERQASKLHDQSHRLSSFIERMCEITQIKLKENDIAQKEKEMLQDVQLQNQILNQTISQISDGYIFVDRNGFIRNYNHQAFRILGVTEKAIKAQNIFSLIPDPALHNLFNQHLNTVYERVYIHNKEYGVFVSFFYDNDEYIGCTLNFKTIDSFGIRIETGSSSRSGKTITLKDYLGECKEIRLAKQMAQKATQQPVNVLITGEEGTGKGTLARAIHGSCNRSDKPFVLINCKAISPESIDEELFGGSETVSGEQLSGSVLGKLEIAHSGTVYLNNIDQLPVYSQFKLLSCIKNRYFIKRGSNRKVYIDCLFIAASSTPLEDLVKQDRFNTELYYSLNGIPISLPPLRQRGDDIMICANHMLKLYAPYFSHKDLKFDKKVILYFMRYTWPGNLHEMDNCIQYMLSIKTGRGQIMTADLLPANIKEVFSDQAMTRKIEKKLTSGNTLSMRDIENQTINDLLNQYGNTTEGKKKVAQKLGISLATLYRRMKEK